MIDNHGTKIKQNLKKSSGSVYNLNYHFVWTPKRRKAVLVENIAVDLKDLIIQKSSELGLTVESLEVMPDHVHVFVSAPPKLSPHKIVKTFKGSTSAILRQRYPQLLRLSCLWSASYYVGSVGFVSESVVRSYIENQKGK